MMFYNAEKVKSLREQYPKGTRIELNSMQGETNMPQGLRGTVNFVDDGSQIHITWDNGRSLAINIEEDSFRKLTPSEIAIEQSKTKSKSKDNER